MILLQNVSSVTQRLTSFCLLRRSTLRYLCRTKRHWAALHQHHGLRHGIQYVDDFLSWTGPFDPSGIQALRRVLVNVAGGPMLSPQCDVDVRISTEDHSQLLLDTHTVVATIVTDGVGCHQLHCRVILCAPTRESSVCIFRKTRCSSFVLCQLNNKCSTVLVNVCRSIFIYLHICCLRDI